MNIKRIMCAVDFSEHSQAASRYAASLAKDFGAELHLVHVFQPPLEYAEGTYMAVPTLPLDAELEKKQLSAICVPEPVNVNRQVLQGAPADELIAYAKEHAIELLVLGTHGRTGLSRLLMGSIAEAVVRGAECPVLTIKLPAPVPAT